MDPPPAVPESSSQPLQDPDCPFCTIIANYPAIDAGASNFTTHPLLDPEKLDPPAFVLLSTPHVVAFLDVAPLVRGHVLVSPRRHAIKVGDLRGDEGAEIGRLLPLISRAVTRAVMPDIPHIDVDYNVIQNNGPGAAQVIPHTHFHVVPRYPFDSEYVPYSKTAKASHQQKGQKGRIPQGMEATRILFGRGTKAL